jgi:RNA methyltransferase, TrmH family
MGLGQGPARGDLTRLVHAAGADPTRVVLEGLHAVKHALRFGAVLDGLWSDRPDDVLALARDLAPDLEPLIARRLEVVRTPLFQTLVARPPETRLIAVAQRPDYQLATIRPGPVVLLDRPRHPGNLGAAIRVAAAADAAAVCSLGGVDPWSAASLRGAAGLQFALPVLALDRLPTLDRPLLALDAAGEPLGASPLPPDAVYAFGSERDGLAADLRDRATRTLAIPMRPGVSSLNLATAVAVLLYTLRRDTLGQERHPGTGQRPQAPT